MEDVILHIGYHKTGTTWLQQFLFKPEYGYEPLIPPAERATFSREFILPTELDVDPQKFREQYATMATRIRAAGLLPVLSAERLSGAFQAGGYDSAVIARRLRETFPNGKVLIVIREQSSMIFSSYVQYVRAGGTRSVSRFFDRPRRAPGFIPGFGLEHYQYDRLIGFYQQLFGPERVLVLPYELFLARPQEFVEQIRRFSGFSEPLSQELPTGKRVNTSYGAFTLYWKRHFNRFFVDSSLNPGVWFPTAPGIEKRVVVLLQRLEKIMPAFWRKKRLHRLQAAAARQLKGQFVASNQRIQALTGLDLAQWGYELEVVE